MTTRRCGRLHAATSCPPRALEAMQDSSRPRGFQNHTEFRFGKVRLGLEQLENDEFRHASFSGLTSDEMPKSAVVQRNRLVANFAVATVDNYKISTVEIANRKQLHSLLRYLELEHDTRGLTSPSISKSGAVSAKQHNSS